MATTETHLTPARRRLLEWALETKEDLENQFQRIERNHGRVLFYGASRMARQPLLDAGYVEAQPRYTDEHRGHMARLRDRALQDAHDMGLIEVEGTRWVAVLQLLKVAETAQAAIDAKSWYVTEKGKKAVGR